MVQSFIPHNHSDGLGRQTGVNEMNLNIKQIQTMPIPMVRQISAQIGNEILKLRKYMRDNILTEEEEIKTLTECVRLENLRSACVGEFNDRR